MLMQIKVVMKDIMAFTYQKKWKTLWLSKLSQIGDLHSQPQLVGIQAASSLG